MIYFAIVLFTIALINACKKEDESDPNVDCTNITSTYNGNMKAIIDDKCTGCHSVGGEAEEDGVFTSFSLAQSHLSKMYDEAILEGAMPPSDETQLTQAEKDAWVCWKKAGYPEN